MKKVGGRAWLGQQQAKSQNQTHEALFQGPVKRRLQPSLCNVQAEVGGDKPPLQRQQRGPEGEG